MNAIKYHILSLTTMKFCIGCKEGMDYEFFYREKDSHCKDCMNKYQRDQRRKIKEEKQSDDIVVQLFKKLLEEQWSSSNSNIISKLDEISNKLDELIIRSRRADK